jgi:hypothetical protein
MGEDRSWVYFAERPNGDIKIGTIVKHMFMQRMNALWRQHGSICIVGVIEGGHAKEAELHGIFHQYRRRSIKMPHRRIYTEFFEPNMELYEYIRANSVDLNRFYNGWQKLDYFALKQKTPGSGVFR